MKRTLFLLPLLYLSLLSYQNEMGTVGYARIQTPFDSAKNSTCFKAPGASTKYRLGNECETWIELGVTQDLSFDNGIRMHNQVRPIFYGVNNEKIDYLRMDEAYTEIYGLLGGGASVWIGRRFYKRYDSHLSDYFFLNMSGDGIGVDNIDLGFSKLAYSFIFYNVDPTVVGGAEKVFFQSHDIRFTTPTDEGEFVLFLNYMKLDSKEFSATQKVHGEDGYALGVLYHDKSHLASKIGAQGENITGLFFGEGIAKGAGAYSPYLQENFIDDMVTSQKNSQDSKTLRFINYNGFDWDRYGLMSNFVYEYKDDEKFSGTKQYWVSAGVRPYWFFSKYARIVGELGYDYIDDKIQNETRYLTKLTGAIEFALERGIFKRPVVRVYYTKAKWDENSKGDVGGPIYADRTSGSNAGVQFEYWW